jgi:Uma2 family endonuclease
MATRNLHEPLLTVEEFLAIEFPPGTKCELDNGVIRMMTGGTVKHAEVQANIMRYLGNALRGSGCKPFSSDLGVQTGDVGLRYPDVTILCGNRPDDNETKSVDNPRMIVEVLSPGTRTLDLGVKLNEYRAIATVATIMLVDPITETVRVIERTGPAAWTDRDLARGEDAALADLGITLPHAEIFARD